MTENFIMYVPGIRVEAHIVGFDSSGCEILHVNLGVIAELVLDSHYLRFVVVVCDLALRKRRWHFDCGELEVAFVAVVPIQCFDGVDDSALDVLSADNVQRELVLEVR